METTTTEIDIDAVLRAVPCPRRFSAHWGWRLIAALGGEVPEHPPRSWCWRHFGKRYQHLRPLAERYFERARTGNAAWGACCMARYCGSSPAWAEGVIERAQTGERAWAAFTMARYCGSSVSWAQRLIEHALPSEQAQALAAFELTWYFRLDRRWGERVIERARRGQIAVAAWYMGQFGVSAPEWVERVMVRARWPRLRAAR